MGKLGCNLDGNLNESKYSEPLPWIGIYVAAASAACALAMAADTFHGFRTRKFWFPCRYFSLNATTLTLIAVAIKLSVDLNTSMPSQQDQLAKLSSGIFLVTVMGNSLPSLGTMATKEIMMNIMAFGILVITAVVNICIQLGTGVIYILWKEHVAVMFLMLVLLALLISSAVTIPATKSYFDLKYSIKLKTAMKECSMKADQQKCPAKQLKEGLMKYWLMAHTSSPQFVMGRLATCAASGAFCLWGAAILAEAMLRTYLMPWSFKFCKGESDYKWSTTLILIAQTVAVGVGTIAPAFRWFNSVNFGRAKKVYKPVFKVERYWIQMLVEWKDCPFMIRIHGRHYRKLAHKIKDQLVDFFIIMQTGMVLMSKLVSFVSIVFVCQILICCSWCNQVKALLKRNNSVLSNESGSESASSKQDLSHYVLHLEGEEDLVDSMANNCDATRCWMGKGKKKQPKILIKLLEKSASSHEFRGIGEFDSDHVPSMDTKEPPSCWALPVVTLTSIAVALPHIGHHFIKELIRSVHEGLIYVRFVEDNLNANENLINVKMAAEVVWLGVDLHHKWLDVDLQQIARQKNNPREVLEELADIAKNRFVEFKNDANGCFGYSPSRWPVKVLAANSMYRLSQNLLLHQKVRDIESSYKLFQILTGMISDIFGACLTNLRRAIYTECHRSTIEEKEESVRRAVLLLGKTEKILKIINQQPLPIPDTHQLTCINEWIAQKKQKNAPHLVYSPSDSDTASSSSELHLTIE